MWEEGNKEQTVSILIVRMTLLLTEKELIELGQKIWNTRKHRWFYEYEIFLLLSIPQTLGIPLSTYLDEKPEGLS